MPELLVILVIVVLLFGTRKLPELGKGVGSAIKNFKTAMRDADHDEIEAPRTKQQIAEGSEPARTADSARTTYGNQA